jgi:hypothetical protein
LELEEQNALLLQAIKKSHAGWRYDSDYWKVVNKIEKGKNLKKDEFDVIHQILFQ